MSRAAESRLYETTYSFLPRPTKPTSLVGIQIGARTPFSPPRDWRIFGNGRQFTQPDQVMGSIRIIPSAAVALSGELVFRPGVFYIGFYAHGFPIREIFEIDVSNYLDIPKKGDPREEMKQLHGIAGMEVIKSGRDRIPRTQY